MNVSGRVVSAVLPLIFGLATSCNEAPQSHLLAPSSAEFAKVSKHALKVVVVRQEPAKETGLFVNTLAEAVELVAPGGVIRLSGGRHVVSSVIVDIPVTIEPLGPSTPVLDAQQAYSSIEIQAPPPAVVTISGLRFENASGHNLQVKGAVGSVTIENSQFVPAATAEGCCVSGVFFYQGSGGPAIVRNNQFSGGDTGIGSFDFAGDLIIDGNTFTGQVAASIQTDARVYVTGNTVSACGKYCVFLLGSAAKDVRQNAITDDASRATETALWISGSPVSVEDNDILGTVLPAGDASGPYSVSFAGLSLYHVDNAIARRNKIRNVATALWLDASTLEASDEIIDGVVGAFGGWGPPAGNSLVLRTSDITNYAMSGGALFGMYSYNFADARCNWWGDASGPKNTEMTLPLTQYAPWATAPIAGTGRAC
jgi:nitrous oxidase accessory protein NosD